MLNFKQGENSHRARKIIIESTRIILLATIFSLGLGMAFAWTDPIGTPPNNNVSAPVNIGPSAQVKQGNLWLSGLNASNNPYLNGLIVENGRVGIGTASPAQKLSVAGMIESTAGGFKFPNGSVQTTSGTTYVAFFKAVSPGSYSINLNTGVVSGGTLTFLGDIKFPAGSVAMGVATISGYNVGYCQQGNGEYARVNGDRMAIISDVTQNVTFYTTYYGCAGASDTGAIFIGR